MQEPAWPVSSRSFTKEPWTEQAACRGMDPALFYPTRGDETANAKAVCAGCPVKAECLAYALAGPEEVGIWGGLSGRERRPMIQRRKSRRRNTLLKPEQVVQIRARHAAGGVTQVALAAEYGVSVYTVFGIIHRESWNDAEELAG